MLLESSYKGGRFIRMERALPPLISRTSTRSNTSSMSAMSASTVKRPLEQSSSPMAPAAKGSKPGRKPLDEEAKNKRTAQNRAAQRAFRERKEKKMKELEDKVQSLEQANRDTVVESEFLRSQLLTLVNELKKYRPAKANDLQVLDYLAKHERTEPTDKEIEQSVQKKMDFTFAFPWKDRKEAEAQAQHFPSPGSSMLSSSSASVNSAASPSNKRRSTASRSTSTSTSTTGWMDNVFYSDDAQKLPQFAIKGDSTADPLFSNEFNFDDQFDEQVSQFCTKMNKACGTRECPIPGFTPQMASPQVASPQVASPQILTNSWDTVASPAFGQQSLAPSKKQLTKTPPSQPELPFIDPTMAFPTDDDEGLFFRTHRDENSLFAELLDEVEPTDNNFVNENLINEEPSTTTAVAEETRPKPKTETDVVPSRDGKLLKCSEVWDRITTHPKYSAIDIDGLCGELMTKAKCSEKGVVVQAEDVQRVLDKHMDV